VTIDVSHPTHIDTEKLRDDRAGTGESIGEQAEISINVITYLPNAFNYHELVAQISNESDESVSSMMFNEEITPTLTLSI
jgi:hypothetical protein